MKQLSVPIMAVAAFLASGCSELFDPASPGFDDPVKIGTLREDSARLIVADGRDRLMIIAEVDPRVTGKTVTFKASGGTFLEATDKPEASVPPNAKGWAVVTWQSPRQVQPVVVTATLDGFVAALTINPVRAAAERISMEVEPSGYILPWNPPTIDVSVYLVRSLGAVSDSTEVRFEAYAVVPGGGKSEIGGWKLGSMGYSNSEQKVTKSIVLTAGDPRPSGTLRIIASTAGASSPLSDSIDLPVAELPLLDPNPDSSSDLMADGVSTRAIEVLLGNAGRSTEVELTVVTESGARLAGLGATGKLTADDTGRVRALLVAGRVVEPIHLSAKALGMAITGTVSTTRAFGDSIVIDLSEDGLDSGIAASVLVKAKVLRSVGRASEGTMVRFIAEQSDSTGTPHRVGSFSGFGLGSIDGEEDIAEATLSVPAGALTAGMLTIRVLTDGPDGGERMAIASIPVTD